MSQFRREEPTQPIPAETMAECAAMWEELFARQAAAANHNHPPVEGPFSWTQAVAMSPLPCPGCQAEHARKR